MNKIIYIVSSNFPPTGIVGALRPYRLAKHIGRAGWKPIIVTMAPKDGLAFDTSLLDELAPDTEIFYINRGLRKLGSLKVDEVNKVLSELINISSRKLKPSGARNILRKIWKTITGRLLKLIPPDQDVLWSLVYTRQILKRLDKNETSLILTTSPSHSIHIVGLLISQLKGLPWVADFRDPWDYYPVTGHYDLINPVSKYLEKRVIRYANAVISSTHTNTGILVKRHPETAKDKFYTITNAYDDKLVNIPSEKDRDYFVISYTGIFYPDKDPYTFFRALQSWFNSMDKDQLEKYGRRLKVQLIGRKDDITVRVVKELILTDVVSFIGQVSHAEAIRLTKGSDMALIAAGIGKKTRPGGYTSKMFEYFGCRVPILAIVREGEMAEVLRNANVGYVITSEDHPLICEILGKEISKKFYNNHNEVDYSPFTFDGIKQFEEKNVFNKMIKIIERVAIDI